MRKSTQHKFILPFVVSALLFFPSCKKEGPVAKPEWTAQNVLIITVDTLRADALSIYGNRQRSNFFERMAERSVLFDRAFTTAPITLPAHTSLFTGLYPPSHGVRNNGTYRASAKLELLSEIAQKNGFATAAFAGAFPLASRFGLDQGFQIYDETFSAPSDSPTTFVYAERNAEAVREATESWVSKLGGKRFFLWMHFFDPHHPYIKHDSTSSVHPYLQEVAYVDQQLGLFFDFLKTQNLISDTLVVLTSDHGEAFGEHGEVSHSIFLYNTTLHVPLLFSVPGLSSQRHQQVVRLVDIFPTILEIMKWSSTTQVDGRSLTPLFRGEASPPVESYAESLAPALDFGWAPLYSIQSQESKFIDAPKPEFYNLKTDPQEKQNAIASGAVEQYKAKILTIRSKKSPDSSAPSLSKEDREKLESLGYLSTGNQRMALSNIDPKDRIDVARKIAELAMSDLSLQQKADAYKEIIKTESANPLLLLRYAEIMLRLNRHEDATAAFEKVIQLNYPSAAAYNGLAAVYFNQKKPFEAQKLLEETVAKNIADGETYYNLGNLYLFQGQPQKALQFFDQSVTSHFLPAYFQKAILLEEQNKTEEALTLLNQAEQINPSSGEIHFHKGMIRYKHQQFQEAIREFQTVLQKEPGAKWILFHIGMVYDRMGDAQKRNDVLAAFLRDGPADMKEERAQARKILSQ